VTGELPDEIGHRLLCELLGRDLEWVMARVHRLPCRLSELSGWPRVRREDLPAWLQAARAPREQRSELGWTERPALPARPAGAARELVIGAHGPVTVIRGPIVTGGPFGPLEGLR
jgi:hypothetical protein